MPSCFSNPPPSTIPTIPPPPPKKKRKKKKKKSKITPPPPFLSPPQKKEKEKKCTCILHNYAQTHISVYILAVYSCVRHVLLIFTVPLGIHQPFARSVAILYLYLYIHTYALACGPSMAATRSCPSLWRWMLIVVLV